MKQQTIIMLQQQQQLYKIFALNTQPHLKIADKLIFVFFVICYQK